MNLVSGIAKLDSRHSLVLHTACINSYGWTLVYSTCFLPSDHKIKTGNLTNHLRQPNSRGDH